MIDLDTYTKLPKNVGHLGKLIRTLNGFYRVHQCSWILSLVLVWIPQKKSNLL